MESPVNLEFLCVNRTKHAPIQGGYFTKFVTSISSSQNGTNSLVVSVSRVPVFLFLTQLALIMLCVFLFFCRFTVSTANNSLTRSLLSSRVHRRSRDDATSDWGWLRQLEVRRANFALNWTRENGKWSRGRPQKTWRLTFGEDLQVMGMSWRGTESPDRWRNIVTRMNRTTLSLSRSFPAGL